MKVKRFDIWLADLNPKFGTEPGKVRPVVIIQTDLLNEINHPSTIVCPISTKVIGEAKLLRVHLKNNLDRPSDILIDQIRSIDNKRLLKIIGKLNKSQKKLLVDNLIIVLDLLN